MVSHLPHSTNTQGFYFDLDNIPDDVVQRISSYLLHSSTVRDEFIRGEKDRVGLINQFTKTMETMQRRKSSGKVKKSENLASYEADSDDDNDDVYDDGDLIDNEYDDFSEEKDIDDDAEMQLGDDDCVVDMDGEAEPAPISNLDALIIKCNKMRSAKRQNMKSAFFTSGWKSNDMREIDEFIRKEDKERSNAIVKRSIKKTSTGVDAKRARARRHPDVLKREEYTDEEM